MKKAKNDLVLGNFKIEELEPRLEMGKWSVGSETTKLVDENGDYVKIKKVTYTITF